MTYPTISTQYSSVLSGYGLPNRLLGQSSFELRDRLASYTLQKRTEELMDTRKQMRVFDTAVKSEPGWILFACSRGTLEYPKHVAANIMQAYYNRGLRPQWLASFDRIDKLPFASFNLVVLDAIFFDSPSYRRDKFYEIINHHCNIPSQSIIVIGQYDDPIAMSQHLGVRPNFGMLLK